MSVHMSHNNDLNRNPLDRFAKYTCDKQHMKVYYNLRLLLLVIICYQCYSANRTVFKWIMIAYRNLYFKTTIIIVVLFAWHLKPFLYPSKYNARILNTILLDRLLRDVIELVWQESKFSNISVSVFLYTHKCF